MKENEDFDVLNEEQDNEVITKSEYKKIIIIFLSLFIATMAGFFVPFIFTNGEPISRIVVFVPAFIFVILFLVYSFMNVGKLMAYEATRKYEKMMKAGSVQFSEITLPLTKDTILERVQDYRLAVISQNSVIISKRINTFDKTTYILEVMDYEDNLHFLDAAQEEHERCLEFIENNFRTNTQYNCVVNVFLLPEVTTEDKQNVEALLASQIAMYKAMAKITPFQLFYVYDKSTNTLYYEQTKSFTPTIRPAMVKTMNKFIIGEESQME